MPGEKGGGGIYERFQTNKPSSFIYSLRSCPCQGKVDRILIDSILISVLAQLFCTGRKGGAFSKKMG